MARCWIEPLPADPYLTLARVRLRERDQLLEGVRLDARIDREDVGREGHERDRGEIRQLPAHALEQMRVADVIAGILHQHGVTVRASAGDLIGGDVAAGPRLVLHNHRLAERLGERIGEETGRDVR